MIDLNKNENHFLIEVIQNEKPFFLDISVFLESDAGKKFDESSIKYHSASLKLWIETLMEEINSVVTVKQ